MVTLAVLLAGCADHAGSARVPPVGAATAAVDAAGAMQLEPSIQIGVVQYRSDIAPGVVQVTLFTVSADQLPLTPDADDEAEVGIRVQVLRCDPHALAEDKLGYFFPVLIAVGGDEPVPVLAAVDVADREPFDRLLRDTCR